MANRVDKTNPKYVIALQFLNHILTNNNKAQINDITEFKDVSRPEILKQENLNVLNDMETELYKHFDKIRCGYYRKTENYVLTFMRNMVKELGYKPVCIERERKFVIDGVKYTKKCMVYHIE